MKKVLLTFSFMLIIAMSYAQTLNEGFEGEAFPPQGWTVKSSGDIYKWEIASYTDDLSLKYISGYTKGGSKVIKSTTGYFSDYEQAPRPNPDSWLITPKQTIKDGDVLNFMMAYNSGYNDNGNVTEDAKIKFEVAVSTTATAPEDFTTVILSVIPQSLGNWNNYSIDLNQFAGQEVYIAFHDYGTPNKIPLLTNSLFLDDITINQTKASDLSVIAVDNPVSGCATEQQVKATVKNIGFDISSFQMYYQVDGNPAVSETVNKTLAGGATEEFTFNAPAILSEGAMHAIKVWAESDKDRNHDNDAMAVSVAIGSEISYPFTMTDENAQTAFSSSYSRAGGKITYGWAYYNDEATKGWGWTFRTGITSYLLTGCIALPQGQVKLLFDYMTLIDMKLEVYLVKNYGIYDTLIGTGALASSVDFSSGSLSVEVPEAGVYSLAIIPASDYTGQVFLNNISIRDPYDDITPLSIDSPFLNATLAKSEVAVTATFKNAGNKNLTQIPVCFQLDDQPAVKEAIASIPAGESVQYTFKNSKLDLSATGMHKLTVWSELSTDGDVRNDTIIHSIASYSAQSFPYKASFEADEANENWIIYNPDKDILYWEPMQVIDGTINYAKDGVRAAYISSAAGMEHNDWLISPAINATKGKARISFYYLTRMNSSSSVAGCNIKVYLEKTDNPLEVKGKTPLTIATLTDENVLQYKQGYAFVDIPEDGQYYLAFYNDGQGHDIVLDDIRLDRDEDMCMISASNSAVTGFNLTDNTVTIRMANHGTTSQSNIPVSYKVNDAPEISEIFTGNVAPGETVTYTFTKKADITACDTFLIKTTVNDVADADSYNNSWMTPVIIHYPNATIPYQADFEDTAGRAYWTFAEGWVTGSAFSFSNAAYNGIGAIYHSGAAKEQDGDWAYSGCIDIPAGTYELSFFYRTFQGMSDPVKYGQNFEVFLGTAPNAESMTLPVYKETDAIVSGKQYEKVLQKVTVDKAGKYYIGVKCTSTTTNGSLFMDLITLASPVTTGLELGTYEADFAVRENEWYRYNPSTIFKQWTAVTENDATYMQTTRMSYSYMDIPTELPGFYVAPAFYCLKNDEINVSFDYQLNVDKPEDLAEEELARINIGIYMAAENMPQAFTTQVATGKTISEGKQTATGKVVIPETGVYYFGFLPDGPIKSLNGNVITTYNLYSAKIWNKNYSSVQTLTDGSNVYRFSENVLCLLKEYVAVKVYTINGMLAGSYSDTDEIDMNGMEKGLYLISIVTADGTVNGKIYVK